MPTETGINIINYVRNAGGVVSYAELADHLGMLPPHLGAPLRPIRQICLDYQTPAL